MKKIILFYFLLFVTVATAQSKLELDGTISGYEGKVKLILNTITPDHEADMINEEVLYMVDGKFRIEKQLDEPTLLSIRIRPETTEDFDPQSLEAAFVWVDNKKMTLTAERGNVEYCDVTGYSRQDENEESKYYVKEKLMAYRRRIDSLSNLKTQEAIDQYHQLKSVSEVYLRNNYLLDYCYLNPDSFIPVYNYSWFVKWIPEMVPKKHALDFYDQLDDGLKASTSGKQIKNYIDNIAVNKRLNIGDRPYNFSLPDSTSTEVSLNSFKNKIILLDFWSSGCGPCRKEHSNYAELYEHFNEGGFEIISISQDRRKEPWLKAMNKDNMTWVSLWDEDMNISKYIYLVSAIPDNYLINRDGIIVAKDIRGDELGRILTKLIKE